MTGEWRYLMRWLVAAICVVALAGCAVTRDAGQSAAGLHVWEKTEITLHATGKYDNPYKDVTLWVDLKGPHFDKRCYGFWDGGDTFRVRVMATEPGDWNWTSGAKRVDGGPADAGLVGKTGTFHAGTWTEAEKAANPNRRGMIRASRNGHAFEYADGTPFFYLADTWWATSTSRFKWRDGEPRQGPLSADSGFKEFVAYRKAQEYNGVTILASFGNWAADDQPAALTKNGVQIRAAWKKAGTDTAKDMTDEAGNRPFEFPGKVPGFEKYFPDVERVNPAYFQLLDKKVDYLNAQGFVPFIEPARRDMAQAWKTYYPWPESYARFVEYVWSRYQANVCFLSPIHCDAASAVTTAEWNDVANQVVDTYGMPPFGNLASTNTIRTTLESYGHIDKARWLGFHQIGNLRTHMSYALLTDIFNAKPPVPAINGEPYYDGMEITGGSEDAGLYCRSAMYGSVLSGGLGGHIYGAGGWSGGVWSGEVEAESQYPMWKAMQWASGDQMPHMKKFVLSEGTAYQDLVPCTARITPNKTEVEKLKGGTGWVFGAGTVAGDLFMLYFERDCPRATLNGVPVGKTFAIEWFDPRKGEWLDKAMVASDAGGVVKLPAFPADGEVSKGDWAVKLKVQK